MKTNIFEKEGTEKLKQIVEASETLTDVLKKYNRTSGTSNYKTLRRILNKHNIDYSNLIFNAQTNRIKKLTAFNIKNTIPLKKVLVKNSNYSRQSLKKRLLRNGILKNECSICKLSEEWNDKKINMVLDHINGIHNDNRIENLRMVCPNCDSQLDTFCGKNKKTKHYYCSCGKEINKQSKTCIKCNTKNHRKVKNRPSKSQLNNEIKTMS